MITCSKCARFISYDWSNLSYICSDCYNKNGGKVKDERMSIIDTISEHIELTELPNGKYNGVCLFCGGVLFVYPEQRSWHCFNCNNGGDEISFITLHKEEGNE